MNSRWIGLPLLDPEVRPFAIAKSPQIRMTVFALIRHEEFDMKRLQGRLIEGQRPVDIVDSQNHVVEHCSLLQITRASTALFTIGYRMDRKRRYVHALANRVVRWVTAPDLRLARSVRFRAAPARASIRAARTVDRKSTRLNSSHLVISYA